MKSQTQRGELLFAQGRLHEAEQVFSTVVEEYPDNKEAHNNLGVIYFYSGEIQKALAALTNSLALDPSYEDAKANFVKVLEQSDASPVMLSLLDSSIDQFIHNPELSRFLLDAKEYITFQGTTEDIFLKCVPHPLRKHKTGMNICIFADFNIAGNLTLIMRLINKYTIHKARCIIVHDDYLSYDQDVVLRPKTASNPDAFAVAEAEKIIAHADFFHIGRWPINFGSIDFNTILHKNNCVIQYFGTEYREHGARLYKMHVQTGIKGISWWDWTMLEHGLLFYHIDHILDVDHISHPPARSSETVKIVHSPTNRSFKNTQLFLDVMEKIQQKHSNVELVLLEGLSNRECLAKKQEAHILFDQISVGMYALNALESLALEQVVLCSLSNFGMSFCPDSPVVPVNEKTLYSTLEYLVTHPDRIDQLGKLGREYVKRKHSPEKGIIQYTYLWDLIKNGFRLMDDRRDLFILESFRNTELLRNCTQ